MIVIYFLLGLLCGKMLNELLCLNIRLYSIPFPLINNLHWVLMSIVPSEENGSRWPIEVLIRAMKFGRHYPPELAINLYSIITTPVNPRNLFLVTDVFGCPPRYPAKVTS
jgi:hypothetical protein